MVAYIPCVLLLLIVSIETAEIKLPCGPGEVSKLFTFRCNISESADFITWGRNASPLVTCVRSTCTPRDTSVNAVSRSGSGTILTINVTVQSSGIYSCEEGVTSISTCNFISYAKPERVVCQDPAFQTATGEVKVVCTAHRAYPNPRCQFSWFLNDTEKHITDTSLIEYNNLLEGGYFKANCSLKLPAQTFTFGKHNFQVRIYPNVTGQVNDTIYGINSILTSPKDVAYPTLALESCPVTYVEDGKEFSCTCRETANTFILATTTLIYGSARVNSTQNITGTFTANRNIGELTCKATLPDGTNSSKIHMIQVAYGPSSVSLKVMYNQAEVDGVISLCDPIQSVTVTVSCSVPANDSSPGVNYQFYSNVTDTPSGPPTMSARNYTVTSGGMFYFLCTGNNSQFPALSAISTTKIIQVTEPPSSPVLEKYQNSGTYVIVAGNQLTVQEGLTRIRCRVEGGYPPVSRLLLTCGSQTNTSMDNNVYIDVNMTRRMDGSNCSCTATHSSSCYRNNIAIALLDVHFGPTIFSFEANNKPDEIIIERNSGVSFSCQAEGNPSPSLSLRKDGTDLQRFSDPTRKFNPTLAFNKIMADCMDTGVYTCLTETGQAAANKTVAVYVKCTQQFRYPDSLSKSHKGQVNGTISITVPVFGYPQPGLALSSAGYIVPSNVYNLIYIKQEPPYGIVLLVINIKNSSFFQIYSLIISNSQGQLTYSFEIVEGVSGCQEGKELNVGAVVGGVVAGVLVLAATILLVVFLKRRGRLPNRGNEDRNADGMLTIPHKETKEDTPAHKQAPENSQYEEIIDVQSDMPDKPVYYANQISSNIHGEEMQYENTVSAL